MQEKSPYDNGFAYVPMKYAPPSIKVGEITFYRTDTKIGPHGVIIEYTAEIGKYKIITNDFKSFDAYFGEKKLTKKPIENLDFLVQIVENLPEEPLYEVNNFPHLIEIDEDGPFVKTVLNDGLYKVYLDGRKKVLKKFDEPIEKIDVVYPHPYEENAFVVYSDGAPLTVKDPPDSNWVGVRGYISREVVELTETPPNPLADELGAAVAYKNTLISLSGWIHGNWKSNDEVTEKIRRIIKLGVNPINPGLSTYYVNTEKAKIIMTTDDPRELTNEYDVPIAIMYIGKSKFLAIKTTENLTPSLLHGVNINVDISFEKLLEYDGERITMKPFMKKLPAKTYRKILKAQNIKINEVLPAFPEDGRIENLHERVHHITTPDGGNYYATIYEADNSVHIYRLFDWTLYRIKVPWNESTDYWSVEEPPDNAEKILELPEGIKVPKNTKIIPEKYNVRVELPNGDVVTLTEDRIITPYGDFDIELLYGVDGRIDKFMTVAKMV